MNLIVPEWPAPVRVKSLMTTRAGGVSQAPWASLNLGDHVGDDPAHVEANRARLRQQPEAGLGDLHHHAAPVLVVRAPFREVAAHQPVHHHQGDAIFLAGIPDLPATLPHP